MKTLFPVLMIAALGLLATPAARAQDGATARASNPAQLQRANDQALRKGRKSSATDIARMQRRMSMNPNEVKRDQQMEVLEARSGMGTANTSFGRSASPARQMEKGSGGFAVRKFKDNRIGTASQKRGQSRPAGFVDPKGKPLNHKKKKHFLFF